MNTKKKHPIWDDRPPTEYESRRTIAESNERIESDRRYPVNWLLQETENDRAARIGSDDELRIVYENTTMDTQRIKQIVAGIDQELHRLPGKDQAGSP